MICFVQDVIKISYGNENYAYLTAIQRSSSMEQNYIYFNNIYAQTLKLNENDLIHIEHIYRDCLFATSITIGNY